MNRRQAILWSLPFALLALAFALRFTHAGESRESRESRQVEGGVALPELASVVLDAPEAAVGRDDLEQRPEPTQALVRGRVDSSVGQWWKGARVFALTSAKRGAQGHVDADGRFELELELASGECDETVSLSLDASDGRRLRQEAFFRPDPEVPGRCLAEVVFALPGRCGVRGSLVDEARAPIEGALVAVLQLSTTDDSYQVLAQEETDREGRFELDFEPKPALLLALVHREFQPGSIPLEILTESALELGPTVLVRGEVVEGTFRANEAEALLGGIMVTARGPQTRVITLGSGPSVHLLGLDQGILRHWIVKASIEQGGFRLTGLAPGSYSLDLVRAEGFASLPGISGGSVVVTAPAKLDLDPTGPELWFRIARASDGGPLRARVTILGAFGEFVVHTDRDGVALILTQPGTAYRVRIEAPGHAHREVDVTSPPSNGFRVESFALESLAAGRLAVELTRRWSGRGRLELEFQGDPRSSNRDVDLSAGSLSLEDLAPGFYSARLSLWGAGSPASDGTREDVVLPFDFRILPGQTSTQILNGP